MRSKCDCNINSPPQIHFLCCRECYTVLQQIESNPLFWLGLGAIYERNGANTRVVFDSYAAAVEVSRPVEAILGSALAWLRLAFDSFMNAADEGRFNAIEVRHQLEHPLAVYLRKRPLHPLAWGLYAWTLEFRGNPHSALAWQRGIWAAERLKVFATDGEGRSRLDAFLVAIKGHMELKFPSMMLVEVLRVPSNASKSAGIINTALKVLHGTDEYPSSLNSLRVAIASVAEELGADSQVSDEDERTSVTGFVRQQGGDPRVALLFAVAVAVHVLATATAGEVVSQGEYRMLRRALYLHPDQGLIWLSLVTGNFSNSVSTCQKSFLEAKLVTSVVNKWDFSSMRELPKLFKLLALIEYDCCVCTTGMLSSTVSPEHYTTFIQKLLSEDVFPEARLQLWKCLGLLCLSLGKAQCANLCFSFAQELVVDIHDATVIDLQSVFGLLQIYSSKNTYEHLSLAREYLQRCESRTPNLAAVSSLNAYIFHLLKKDSKAEYLMTTARTSQWHAINSLF